MIVIASPRADTDLDNIGLWIARDNPRLAVTFVRDLRKACERIGDTPFLYAIVPGSRSLRKTVFAPYLIFYRVRHDAVFIVAVRHGARDNSRLR